MRKFDAVFFDAGNTLVRFNMTAVAEALARHDIRVDPPALEEAEYHVRLEFDQADVIGSTTDSSRFPRYIDAILRRAAPGAGTAVAAAGAEILALTERNNLWDQTMPEAVALLTRLRRNGYRLGIVTNAPGTATATLMKIGLTPLVDDVVESAIVGIEKPDPRIFRLAADRLKVDPKRAIFIGDLYHVDVVGAEAAGFAAVLIDPADLQPRRPCLRIRALGELERLLR